MAELQTSIKVFFFAALVALGLVLGVYIYKNKGGRGLNLAPNAGVQNIPIQNAEMQTTYHQISTINDPEITGLNTNVQGYIVFKNACMCPEGAACKPCDPLIVVSENNTALNSLNEAKNTEMIITVKDATLAKSFKMGDQVKLEVVTSEIGAANMPKKAVLVSIK